MFMLRTLILGLVFPVITAGILFFLVTGLFRAKGTFEAAFRVNAYSSAVNLLTWLPLAGLLFEFYRVYLIATGLSIAFRIPLLRGFLAILMTMAVYIVAAGVIGYFGGGGQIFPSP